MQEIKQKQYNPAIDILRIICILAVVLIHTTTRTLEASAFDLQRVPWTLFLNQISRFAVPLFFMISGFVLELNYSFHTNYFAYLKKRFNRIFIPYVFWSAIYYYFVYTNHNIGFLNALVQGSSSYQLYFIPSLLIFYMVFPLIHKLYGFLGNKWVLIFLGIIQLMLLYQDYYVHTFSFTYPIRIALLNYYVFILGVFVSHHEDKLIKFVRKWRFFILILTGFLASYIFLEGKTLYLKTHNHFTFYSQWRPSVFFYTISIGALLYYFFKNKSGFLMIKSFARYAFFVFFIHIIVLEIIWKNVGIYIFHQTNNHIAEQFWYDPLFFLTVAFISFFVAYLAHKIPLLAKLSG